MISKHIIAKKNLTIPDEIKITENLENETILI